jgi:hypothetical protein
MELKAIHTQLQDEVLDVLHYYLLFHYPLTVAEIQANFPSTASVETIEQALDNLVNKKKVYTFNGYYSIEADIKSLVVNRTKGNKLAAIKQEEAKRSASIIYKFPFVRFVGLSGSLSKGYAQEDSDFDFFIITAKNRLWICRTLLHIFKKFTFLTGSQDKYCMNYFIDTEKIEIEDKNRYTAVELATLIPIFGSEYYKDIVHANKWITQYLPNATIKEHTIRDKKHIVKGIVEAVIDLLHIGNPINYLLMKLTDSRWKTKWYKRNYPINDYNIAFKTTLHISKNHPANYQKRVLKHLSERVNLKFS